MVQVVVLATLGICSIMDCLHRKIWMPLVFFALISILVCCYLVGGWQWGRLAAGLAVGIFFCGISVVTGGQLGSGDGILLGMISLTLGIWEGLAFLMFSFFYAFVVALFLVVFLRWKRNAKMPFVPFLLLGYITVWLLA